MRSHAYVSRIQTRHGYGNFKKDPSITIMLYKPYHVKTCFFHMSFVVRKPAFCIRENKDADQLRGNREADQRLCFRYIVQFLYFLNPKFQASNHLMWLYSLVCVGPGWKPRRPVFSQRGSYVKNKGTAQLRYCEG